jgi:subtilisin-like proprotein convertase family protein
MRARAIFRWVVNGHNRFVSGSAGGIPSEGSLQSTLTVDPAFPMLYAGAVQIAMAIDHPNIEELVITLEHDDEILTLYGAGITFWDFMPVFLTYALDETYASGDWTLRVTDAVPGEGEGGLEGWSLRFVDYE